MEGAPVIISGAGPCGLMCATVLQRHGVPFVIVERAEEATLTSDVGSGFDMAPTAMRIFRMLGLPYDEYMRKVSGLSVMDMGGSVVRGVRFDGFEMWSSKRSSLQEMLKNSLDNLSPIDFCFGVGVSSYTETDNRVTAHLSDGSSIEGCALLACEGWKSRVRAQMHPDDPPHFCQVAMWWGKAELPGELSRAWATKNEERDGICFNVMLGDGNRHGCLVGYYLEKDGDKDRFIWAAARHTEAEPESSDNLQIRGGVRSAQVTDELLQFMGNYSELAKGTIESTPRGSVTKVGLYDRENLDLPFVSPGGRVALLGDSAHPQTPFQGQGCNMALADAFATCTRIAKQGDVKVALQALDAPERREGVKKVILDARRAASFATTTSSCLKALMRIALRWAPAKMVVWGMQRPDECNKVFVEKALADCGLPL